MSGAKIVKKGNVKTKTKSNAKTKGKKKFASGRTKKAK